jgi:hypothetical protein
MTNLSFRLETDGPSDISFGTLADFVSGLHSDPGDAARPSLSEYFTTHGVDAGMRFHQSPGFYIESNLWGMNNTATPADGQEGSMSITSGQLSYGAEYNAESGAAGFVEGRIARQSGQSNWTAPTSEEFEVPVYDDDLNEIGTTMDTIETDGFHNFADSITTLYAEGYANTQGAYSLEAGIQNDRTLQISDYEFGLYSEAAIGITDEAGGFAQAGAQMRALLHEDTGTYGYVEGMARIAQNDEYNEATIGTGVITSVMDNVANGALSFLPPAKVGIEHDFNSGDTKPAAGFEIRF